MTDFRDNLRGILAMLACCLSFIVNDTMVKVLGASVPLGQIVFWRGVLSTVLIGAVAWRLGAFRDARERLTRPVIWRGVGEVASTWLYLSALMFIPIANASTIAQAAPLVITGASAIFLAEKVGVHRWAAIVIGFVGILIIVRPGAAGFNGWSLVTLASVFSVALRDMATRFVPATTPTAFVAFVTTVMVTIFGGGLALTETAVPLGLREMLLIAGTAVLVLLGNVFAVIAMRHGDVSVVAPFRYAFIPYAIVIGYLVWGDVPDGLTVLGIAIVVATGGYTFWRERRLTRAHRPAAAADPSVA